LWAHAEDALDVKPTEIKAFTWRDAYLTPDEERLNLRSNLFVRRPVYSAHTHFNAVRLTNDDVVPLPVIAKPAIPDSMPVTVKEIAS
jgi:hypothetical protein